MFGTDEHSLALLGQWRQAKKLRDPEQVTQMAQDKGLDFAAARTLDAQMYHVSANGKQLFYGNFEDAAKFVSEYNVAQRHPPFSDLPRGRA